MSAVAAAPFEFWYVSERLQNNEQRVYRVRSGTHERLVQESELIGLDNLLNSARAKKTDETRNALLFARYETQRIEDRQNRKLAPKRLLDTVRGLERSIARTLELLEELKRYRGPDTPRWNFDSPAQRSIELVSDDIGMQAHYSGSGVVDILQMPSSSAKLEVFSDAIHGAVLIRMSELLQAWRECVKRVPRTRNSRPPDPKTNQIVRLALGFCHQYSVEKLTRRDLRKFVTEFHKFVTGNKPSSGLSFHIEKVLNEFPSLKCEKPSAGKSLKKCRLKNHTALKKCEYWRASPLLTRGMHDNVEPIS